MITACLIVKNEEKYIGQCLRNLSNIVDEIVIVDTGSVDKTINIAKQFNVKIYYHKWNNNFAEARNHCLKYANTNWVLIIDADETIELTNLKYNDLNEKIGGIKINIKNYIDNKLDKFSTHQYTRIFRNKPEFRFEGIIHEQISESILKCGYEIIESDIEITHYGYINTSEEKKIRNKTLLENVDLNDDYNKLNYADTLFSLNEIEKAINFYIELIDSEFLSEYQNDHVKIRIGQIYLKQNHFSDVKKILEFSSTDVNLEGLRKFVLAASLLSNKEYKDAQYLYNELDSDNSNLIDKNLITNALNVLKQFT